MNLRTFVSLLRGGQLAVLPAMGRATRDYHRVAFLAAGLRSGWLKRPAAERPALLRLVRSFLKLGGRLLLTTECRGRSAAAAVLDLWGAMTAGCGRLPEPGELAGQMAAAGFVGVASTSLIPGESFYASIGTNPG